MPTLETNVSRNARQMKEAALSPIGTKRIVARLIAGERRRVQIAGERRRKAAQPRSWLSDNLKWLLATLVIPAVTWIVGYQLQQRERIWAANEKEIEIARQATEAVLADARNDVAAMTALLPALADSNERTAALALVVLTRLKDAQRGDPKIQALFDATLRRIAELRGSSNTDERSLGARKLEAVQNASGSTRQTNAQPVKQIAQADLSQVQAAVPSRVYLQIFSDDQLSSATSVQALLRNQAVPVPGIENVGQKFRPGTLPGRQVRYFNDADIGAARWTKTQLEANGFGAFEIFKTRSRSAVPAGQIEIWWANSRSRPT